MKMFDWSFFLLLFATGLASYCALKLNDVYRSNYLIPIPPMAREPKVSLIITLINFPVYWSNVAVLIYGFFILPWYVVLLCLAASFIAVPLCHVALRFLPGGFINPFTAMLLSWMVLFVVAVWYFWFR
jgi:hypothetical protein